MTEQDKVTVDDIIGIVKTEEQTNSVEEVRKLRGRGNETAKRFTHKEDNWEILDNGEHLAYAHSDYQAEKICELLNELHEDYQDAITTLFKVKEENEQLKTTIQQLRTDNTKQKKKLNTTMKENEHIKQTIKDMINTERTEIGKMTLRQLWRQIQ